MDCSYLLITIPSASLQASRAKRTLAKAISTVSKAYGSSLP